MQMQPGDSSPGYFYLGVIFMYLLYRRNGFEFTLLCRTNSKKLFDEYYFAFLKSGTKPSELITIKTTATYK